MSKSVRRFLAVATAALILTGVLAASSRAGGVVRVLPSYSTYSYAPAYSYTPSYRMSYYTPGVAYVNYDPFYAVPSYYTYPPRYSNAYYATPPYPYYRPYPYAYNTYYGGYPSNGVRYYFP